MLMKLKLAYGDAMILIVGDLNARIKDVLDYIPADDTSYTFGETEYNKSNFISPRQSKDKRLINVGRTLINVCTSYDMHVMK